MTSPEQLFADELIEQVRRSTPAAIAKELCSVQAMPSDMYKRLAEEAMSEDELIKNGYRPVSSLGLMWIKE